MRKPGLDPVEWFMVIVVLVILTVAVFSVSDTNSEKRICEEIGGVPLLSGDHTTVICLKKELIR